jgi:hypothetical protein
MTNEQTELLSKFKELSLEDQASMIKILIDANRSALKTKGKTEESSSDFKVGDWVVVTMGRYVSAMYHNRPMQITKVAPLHLYLHNPKKPEKAEWPLPAECKKCDPPEPGKEWWK